MDNKKINYIQLINGFYNIGAPHILGSVATSLALAVLHKLNALYFPESAPISNPEITSLSGISIYKLSRARESLNTYTYNGKWVFRYTASENQGAGIYEINYEILMNPFVKITQELPNDYPSITQELSSDSPNVTQELPKSYPSFNQEQPLDSPNVTQELPGSPSFFSKNAHDLRPTIPTIPTIPTEQTEQKNTNPTQRVARGNVFDFVKSSSISNLGEGIKRKRKTDTEIEELKNLLIRFSITDPVAEAIARKYDADVIKAQIRQIEYEYRVGGKQWDDPAAIIVDRIKKNVDTPNA